MLEVPLIVMATVVLLAVVLPHLPVVARKLLALVGGVVVIAGLYYMIVIPGWQGNAPRPRRPWNLIIFVTASLLIALGIVFYVVKG